MSCNMVSTAMDSASVLLNIALIIKQTPQSLSLVGLGPAADSIVLTLPRHFY